MLQSVFFMECDDKEDIGPRRDATYRYRQRLSSCIFIYLTVVYAAKSWFFSYVGAESRTPTFFFLIPIRPGQQQRCPRARSILYSSARISFSVTHSLPRVHLLNLAYSFRLFALFSSRFLLFSLSLAPCIPYIFVVIQSRGWNIVSKASRKAFNFQRLRNVL